MSRFVWIGQRGEDADLLAGVSELAGVVCCDWSERLAEQASEIPVLSLENRQRLRQAWSSASLAAFAVEDLRTLLAKAGLAGPILILPYQAIDAVERALDPLGDPSVVIAAPQARQVKLLDDKVLQRQLFAAWNIPAPSSIVLAGVALEQLPHAFRLPAIVQRARGSLGKQTRRIESVADLAMLPESWRADPQLLISEYLPGRVLNITAVTTDKAVHVAWPSIQLVGSKTCGAGHLDFLYCGNDFAATAALPSDSFTEVVQHTITIGDGLRDLSFKGTFGVDFLFTGDRVLALEVNPRFQGSSALLTALEAKAERRRTVEVHIAAFALSSGATIRQVTPDEPLSGAEVVLYNDSGQEIVMHRPVPRSDITFRGFPLQGTRVEPGASLGRIRFDRGILESDLETLAPEVVAVITEIRREILPEGG